MRKFIIKVIEHKIFQISIYIKGFYGLIEALAGVFLLVINHRFFAKIIQSILGQEVSEYPPDMLSRIATSIANSLSIRVMQLISLHMIVHGIVNVGIVLALLHKKLWVFPIVSALLALMIMYQIFFFVSNHSLVLLIMTFVDIIIFALLGFEYHRQKSIEKK